MTAEKHSLSFCLQAAGAQHIRHDAASTVQYIHIVFMHVSAASVMATPAHHEQNCIAHVYLCICR